MNIPRIPILFKLLKVQNEAQACVVWSCILAIAAVILGSILGSLTFG